jgi:GntR family transcriptional regulator, transcriptional repressor for pyruvate dehydrogenase complex
MVIFRPVRTGNAFEEAVERILQAVKLGVFPHGSRLPVERDLAVRLNVSRATVRDAIRSLQEAGYVTSRHGRYGGTFVAYQIPEPGPEDLRRAAADISDRLDDAIIYRHVLEAGAAERAALTSFSEQQRDYLTRRLMEVASASSAQYRLADSRFHLAIAELTASPSLTASIAECRMRLNDLLNAIPQHRARVRPASGDRGGDPGRGRRGRPAGDRRARERDRDLDPRFPRVRRGLDTGPRRGRHLPRMLMD